MRRRLALGALLVATFVAASATPAAAHTETDLVAVPAGGEATVTLKPTHGCGESPTVAVRIRAPMPDASAEAVDGWTATATPDGAGRTVLEWTGGPLAADEDGAFPVEFVVPDTPGELLVFPAIQVCENGEELAWISGDPADEFPAPRVLVLPAGSAPAATIDDVPLDAPGHDQLVGIVDVDNPQVVPTTAVPTTAAPTPTTAPAATSAAPTTATTPAPTAVPVASTPSTPSTSVTDPSTPVTGPPTTEGGSGGGSAAPILIAVVLVAAVVMAGAAVLVRRRG